MQNHLRNSLLGLAVGDALGVPFEFKERGGFTCTGMTFAKIGNQFYPPGTWSDDTALTLAELDSFAERERVELESVMENFLAWYLEGKFSCTGRCFGAGRTTLRAITNFAAGIPAPECGGERVHHNGNGALMRIMPFSLLKDEYRRSFSFKDAVSVTHRHPISVTCCKFYDIFLRSLAETGDLSHSYQKVYNRLTQEEKALISCPTFEELTIREENNVKSGAYVIDTLFASIWCVEKTTNYKDAVLKAVNLGEDTDTTGAVTGSIAGLLYGSESADGIPCEWVDQLQKKQWLAEIAEKTESMMI